MPSTPNRAFCYFSMALIDSSVGRNPNRPIPYQSLWMRAFFLRPAAAKEMARPVPGSKQFVKFQILPADRSAQRGVGEHQDRYVHLFP